MTKEVFVKNYTETWLYNSNFTYSATATTTIMFLTRVNRMNKNNMKTLNEQQTTIEITKFIYYSIFIIYVYKKILSRQIIFFQTYIFLNFQKVFNIFRYWIIQNYTRLDVVKIIIKKTMEVRLKKQTQKKNLKKEIIISYLGYVYK